MIYLNGIDQSNPIESNQIKSNPSNSTTTKDDDEDDKKQERKSN